MLFSGSLATVYLTDFSRKGRFSATDDFQREQKRGYSGAYSIFQARLVLRVHAVNVWRIERTPHTADGCVLNGIHRAYFNKIVIPRERGKQRRKHGWRFLIVERNIFHGEFLHTFLSLISSSYFDEPNRHLIHARSAIKETGRNTWQNISAGAPCL